LCSSMYKSSYQIYIDCILTSIYSPSCNIIRDTNYCRALRECELTYPNK